MPELATPDLKSLKLSPRSFQVSATEGGVIGTQVSAVERMTRLERFDGKSELPAFLRHVENTGKALAGFLGIDRAGDEIRACTKFADKMDADVFTAGVQEILNLPPEEQVRVLSGGMESMVPVVKSLLDTRAQAPELSGEVIANGLKQLGEWYKNGTAEDQARIDKFFGDMSDARTAMWSAMDKMWAAQKAVDMANYARRGAHVGMPSSQDEKFRFSHRGGPIRRLVATIQSIPGGAEAKGRTLVSSPDTVSEHSVHKNLAKLRQLALSSGKGVDADDIAMWRQKIVSTKELGKYDVEELKQLTLETPLTTEEIEALTKKQQVGGGKFMRASEAAQIEYFGNPETGFFVKKAKQAEQQFETARDHYLSYSPDNKAGKNAANIAGGVAYAIADSEVFLGLPTGFAELIAKGGDYPLRFIGMVGKGTGEGVSFVVDSLESDIAKHGLEQLLATTVVGREAVKNLSQAIQLGDRAQITEASAVMRGWASLNAREVMDASRKDATTQMTKGKNLGMSVALTIPELGRAALEGFTGGVLVDNQTKKVIDELVVRNAALDGQKVTDKFSEAAKDKLGIAEDSVATLFSETADRLGIPEEYRDSTKMEGYLKSNLFIRMAEGIRKLVGPEWAAKGGAWEALTEGSRRETVDVIKANLSGELKMSEAVALAANEQTLNPQNTQQALEVSTANTVNEAKREFAKAKVENVDRRRKLDKMWSLVAPVISFSGAAGVVSMTSHLLQVPLENLEGLANHTLTSATTKLTEMRNAAAEIVKIAKESGMNATQSGVGIDVLFQQAKIWILDVTANGANHVANYMSEAKIIGPMLAKATLLLGAARGAFEAAPLRSRVRTKLWSKETIN